jgi:exonuclease SbcC
MLLQRIRLKGFLGHHVPAGATSDGFVDIDLRSSPLWLIHGPNGGGKSSLWDAVTFALFKRHRGGGRNFERLIHDAADDAVIELYFELPGPPPQQYRIRSTITKVVHRSKKVAEKSKAAKRKEESAKTWNVVERLVGEDDWESVPGTTGKAEEWAQQQLSMSYETFVCAVLLRQGEADAFIKAEPAKRKKLLLELLQLEFYEELGKKANEHRGRWKAQRDKLADTLLRIPQPTTEEIEAHNNKIGEAEAELSRASATVEEKEGALAGARQAGVLLQQMESLRERQRADEALLGRAARIEADANLCRELRDATLALSDLWEARRALEAESGALEDCEAKVAERETQSAELAARLERARAALENAEALLASASGRLKRAADQRREAEQQAKELERIELAERDVRAAEDELKPYLPILHQRQRIEEDYERRAELAEGLPVLEDLAEAIGRLEEARGRLAEAQSALRAHEEEERRASQEEDRLRLAVDALSAECEELRASSHERSLELAPLRGKLEGRNEASDKDKCPTCGSELDERAKKRIKHERVHWSEEVARLEAEVAQLVRLTTEKKQALEGARAQHSAAAESTAAAACAASLRVRSAARRDAAHPASPPSGRAATPRMPPPRPRAPSAKSIRR